MHLEPLEAAPVTQARHKNRADPAACCRGSVQALTAMCEGAAADAEAVEAQYRAFAAAVDKQMAAAQEAAAREGAPRSGATRVEGLHQVPLLPRRGARQAAAAPAPAPETVHAGLRPGRWRR